MLAAFWDKIAEALTYIWDSVGEAIYGVLDFFTILLEVLMYGDWGSLGDKLGEWFKKAEDGVFDFISGIVTWAIEFG